MWEEVRQGSVFAFAFPFTFIPHDSLRSCDTVARRMWTRTWMEVNGNAATKTNPANIHREDGCSRNNTDPMDDSSLHCKETLVDVFLPLLNDIVQPLTLLIDVEEIIVELHLSIQWIEYHHVRYLEVVVTTI